MSVVLLGTVKDYAVILCRKSVLMRELGEDCSCAINYVLSETIDGNKELFMFKSVRTFSYVSLLIGLVDV